MSKYTEYISSEEWIQLKVDLLQQRGCKCERCEKVFKRASKLQLHHLTYDRLFNEKPSDLQLVCRNCHMVLHGLAKDFVKKGQRIKNIKAKEPKWLREYKKSKLWKTI